MFVVKTAIRAIYTATMVFIGIWHDEGMLLVTEGLNQDGHPPRIWGAIMAMYRLPVTIRAAS